VFLSKEDLNPFKVPTPMPLPTTLFVDNTPELVKQAVVESEAKAETEEKAEKPGLCLKLTKPPNHLYSSNHIPYR